MLRSQKIPWCGPLTFIWYCVFCTCCVILLLLPLFILTVYFAYLNEGSDARPSYPVSMPSWDKVCFYRFDRTAMMHMHTYKYIWSMNHLVTFPRLYLKLQTNTTSPPTLASASLFLNRSENQDTQSPSLTTPTVEPDETNAETLLLGLLHHAVTVTYNPQSLLIEPENSPACVKGVWRQSCLTEWELKPNQLSAEWLVYPAFVTWENERLRELKNFSLPLPTLINRSLLSLFGGWGIPRAWWGANDKECATLTLLEGKNCD